MNRLYDGAANALMSGTLDLDTDALNLAPYTYLGYNPAHVTLADLFDSPAAAPQPLTNRSVATRTLYADNITFPAVSDDVRVLLITRASDGLLVAYIDTRPDRMKIFIDGNGGALTVEWNQRAVISL